MKYSSKVWVSVLIFLIAKIPFIIACPDLIYSDECVFGTLTQEIISGLESDISEYIYHSYSSNEVVFPIILIPYFVFFGSGVLTIKIINLVINFIFVVSIYSIVKRLSNNSFAYLSFILSSISFPTFNIMSLMYTNQLHITTGLLSLAVISYIIFGCKNKKAFLLLGISCGFVLWISYSFLVTLTLFLVLTVFYKKELSKKNLSIFFISFIIGLGPWIYYNLSNDFSSVILTWI